MKCDEKCLCPECRQKKNAAIDEKRNWELLERQQRRSLKVSGGTKRERLRRHIREATNAG